MSATSTLVSSEAIRQAIKDWIDETGNDNIEEVFNSNFDDEIKYDPKTGYFETPMEIVEQLGLDDE